MSNADLKSNRPLSPHLQFYRLTLTMAMSIIHRITGGALYFGSILLAIWLVAAASGPGAFDVVNAIYGSIIGRLILFGYTWALIHHMLGGIRHFIWDLGKGFEPSERELIVRIHLIASISLTILLWIIGLIVA